MQAFGKIGAKQLVGGSKQDLEAQMMRPIRGAHILLVDDNEINQQIAVEILESAGLKLTVANNGLECLEWVKRKMFDAILMDVQMPVIDGYQATRIIRGELGKNDLPIIAVTANAMLQDKAAAITAGMNDHVSKPIDIKVLFNSLLKWIPH